jgi:hypothetical protein
MLAVNALKNKSDGGLGEQNSQILYIDCENAFSPKRIQELLSYSNERCPFDPPFPDLAATSSRIRVEDIKSSVDFSKLLENLEATIIKEHITIIFLDSIAALVRHEFDSNAIFRRQNLLAGWARELKSHAERFNIPIVVTNQVTSSAGPSLTEMGDPHNVRAPIAALGTGWYHSVNTRLTLQKCRINDFGITSNTIHAHMKASAPTGCTFPEENYLRCLGISKSPISPVVSFPYFISRCGLCLVKRLNLGNAMDVDGSEEYIFEYESANYWFNG